MKQVYAFLVNRGKSPLRIISQSIEGLPMKKIKQCLLVLIQHNLVEFTEYLIPLTKEEKQGLNPSDPLPTDSIYRANLANAIHRLRFPKFIHYIRQLKGDESVAIIEELVEHGRLTMEQVVHQAATCYSSRVGNLHDNAEVIRHFEEVFTRLIMEQFLMRAPKPVPTSDSDATESINKETKNSKAAAAAAEAKKRADPFSLPASFSATGPLSSSNIIPNLPMAIAVDHQPPMPDGSTNKKGAKKTPSKTTKKPAAATRKRKTAGAADEDEEQFPNVLMVSESAPVDIPNESENNNNNHSTANINQPYKKRALDLYTVTSQEETERIINDEKRILWTINYEQFITEFKLRACYDFVTEKINQECGLLFNSMIRLCKNSIRSNQDSQTACIYGENILHEYNREIEDGVNKLDRPRFEQYSQLMQATKPSLITKMNRQTKHSTSGSDLGVFQVNVGNIVGVTKQKMVESIVRQKFGENGLRVFKLLLIKNLLEPLTIAKMAMIPIKECKTLLFNMMDKGIIRLQEVPRSNDHFANRTFYLFFVDLPSLLQTLTEDIFKGIFNARERLKSELDPHRELIAKMEKLPEDHYTEDQTRIVKKVQRIVEILETVVLNLDNDLLHLYNF
uniref:DNA-directed RNA polymerase III subunit RPC3 n=1 Tax=Coremiostelium polycephalum TaxID=142831 RepID=A0A1L2FUP9_9MYCE|nr:RNA polymerase III subunit [Coremiostelium polycephalum]